MLHPNLKQTVLASGAFAVVVLRIFPVSAGSVIDLDTPHAEHVDGTVMDLDAPRSAQRSAKENASPNIALSTSGRRSIRMLRGHPRIEAMIANVARGYMGHHALRRADLSASDWLVLFRANIAVESAFDPGASSKVGAIGLGQLMPETAADLGVDPHDPYQNLHGSARYLLAQLARFGSLERALAAYNAGPDAVMKSSGVPPYRETEGHVRKVMAIFHQSLDGDTP